MMQKIGTPGLIAIIVAAVALIGFFAYRSQPRYEPPPPMKATPPPMPPLVQGPDGRMRPATTP